MKFLHTGLLPMAAADFTIPEIPFQEKGGLQGQQPIPSAEMGTAMANGFAITDDDPAVVRNGLSYI